MSKPMLLKKLIAQSGKTRAEIIEEVGCSQSYLSLVEGGERNVGPRYLKKMASALSVRPDQLRPDLASMFGADDPRALQNANSSVAIQDPGAGKVNAATGGAA